MEFKFINDKLFCISNSISYDTVHDFSRHILWDTGIGVYFNPLCKQQERKIMKDIKNIIENNGGTITKKRISGITRWFANSAMNQIKIIDELCSYVIMIKVAGNV